MGDVSTVEMVVVKVSPYLSANRPLLWLCEKEADSPRLLPIAIGQFEAAAIQMQLDKEVPPRPISYDLLATVLGESGVKVPQIIIHSVRKHTFYAKIVIDKNQEMKEIDSRPSDAVALALRVGASIHVSQELLEQAGLESMDDEPDVERTMARFYETEPQIVEKAPVAGSQQPKTAPSQEGPSTEVEEQVHPAISVPVESESASTSTPETGEDQELSILQAKLEQAVLCEEYEAAAKLRDQIEELLNKSDS